MLISELIAELQAAKEEHGDIQVVIPTTYPEECDEFVKADTFTEDEIILSTITGKKPCAVYRYDYGLKRFLDNPDVTADTKYLSLRADSIDDCVVCDDFAGAPVATMRR